jgi:hypothetical protein
MYMCVGYLTWRNLPYHQMQQFPEYIFTPPLLFKAFITSPPTQLRVYADKKKFGGGGK